MAALLMSQRSNVSFSSFLLILNYVEPILDKLLSLRRAHLSAEPEQRDQEPKGLVLNFRAKLCKNE